MVILTKLPKQGHNKKKRELISYGTIVNKMLRFTCTFSKEQILKTENSHAWLYGCHNQLTQHCVFGTIHISSATYFLLKLLYLVTTRVTKNAMPLSSANLLQTEDIWMSHKSIYLHIYQKKSVLRIRKICFHLKCSSGKAIKLKRTQKDACTFPQIIYIHFLHTADCCATVWITSLVSLHTSVWNKGQSMGRRPKQDNNLELCLQVDQDQCNLDQQAKLDCTHFFFLSLK